MTKLAIASGLIGVVLMVGFEHTLTRILGVAGLLGFIAIGVFAIATPENLGDDAQD